MLDVLISAQPKHNRGRPASLSVNDELLLALSYWREYRTLFHVGMDYGISESSAHRVVQKIEDILIKSELFHLPKKPPKGSGLDMEVVLVDATEMRIERPKKTEKVL